MLTSQSARAKWELDAFMATIHQGRVAMWSWNPTERYAILDPLARRMWGDLDGERHSLEDLFERVHPDDRDGLEKAWAASADSPEPYEFDFRIGDDEKAIWISARGVGGEHGRSGDEVLAVFVDVTKVHESAQAHARLVQEMAHRTSNLFTVAQSMARLAANEATDAQSLAADLERRFMGLAAAYRFAVTQTGAVAAAPLGRVAEEIMSPFAASGEITVDVPDVRIEGQQVANFAVVLHELTTNAVKYGALSEPGGRLSLAGECEGDIVALRWREEGGPLLTELPGTKGFGSRLIEHTMRGVFGGDIQRRIEDGNLHVDLTLDARRLAR